VGRSQRREEERGNTLLREKRVQKKKRLQEKKRRGLREKDQGRLKFPLETGEGGEKTPEGGSKK